MSCHPPSTKFLEREKDKIFKSSGFFRIEYVSPPLEKKKKETWLRCSSRIPCLGNFPAGPFGFSIYTWWFFHQFFRPGGIYRSDESHFDHFVSRVENSSSIIFPILVSFSTFFLLFNVNLILFLIFDISIIYKLKIRNKEKLFDRLSYILEFNLTLIHHLTEMMPLYPSKESTLDPFSIL